MELVKFDEARRAVLLAKSIDEVLEIKNKMDALRLYFKQQRESLEMQNHCAEISIRASRRAGEILKEMPKNEGAQLNGRTIGGNTMLLPKDDTPTLAELGIEKMQSSRFQTIAAVPEAMFEEAIAEAKTNCDELTASRILKLARRYVAKNDKIDPPPLAGKFRVIYADPPWKYNDNGLDDYGHAERHYPPMTIQELCDIGDDVKDLSEDNSVLFLWVTSPLLESSFQVIRAWGFSYKTSFVWDKVGHNFGHYNSVRHEFLLVCTRGSCTPDIPDLIDSVQTIERTAIHSEKPPEFRNIIDRLYPTGYRIELFAREKTENWEVWGNEPETA